MIYLAIQTQLSYLDQVVDPIQDPVRYIVTQQDKRKAKSGALHWQSL